jgi:Bacterial Ig-like domain
VNKGLNNLTILGSNFGTIGTVWVEYYPPVSKWERDRYFTAPSEKKKDRKKKEDDDISEKEWAEEFRYYRTRLEEQFNVTPKTPDWTDNRILISLDGIKGKLNHQKYVIRVEKDGLLTYANSDAAFELFQMVVQLNPDDGSINVPIYSSITAKFDEPIQISSFVLHDSNNNEVPGTFELNGLTATFKPSRNLHYNTRYQATLITGATDDIENPKRFEKTWSFTTEGSSPSITLTTSLTPADTTPLTSINKELGITVDGDNKIRIGVGIIFFNDYSSLKRCINSINDGVDIIFAIDGKFPNFPGNSYFSTDGSRELVKSYPKCLLVDCPRPEFEKRKKYS